MRLALFDPGGKGPSALSGQRWAVLKTTIAREQKKTASLLEKKVTWINQIHSALHENSPELKSYYAHLQLFHAWNKKNKRLQISTSSAIKATITISAIIVREIGYLSLKFW
jgi:hypothetical protein